MSRLHRLSAATLALLAWLPISGHAQVISGSAQITNFSVQLTDLSATDFTVPSLTNAAPAPSVNLRNEADLSGVYTGSPENQTSWDFAQQSLLDAGSLQDGITLRGGQALASKSAGELSVQFSSDASTFSNVTFGSSRGAPQGAHIESRAATSTTWTLSRNTEAVFTGTLRLSAQADASSMLDLANVDEDGARALTQLTADIAMFAMRGGEADLSVFDGGQPFQLWQSITFSDTAFRSAATVPEVGDTPFFEQAFSIRVRNASNQALTLSFDATLSAFGSVITQAAPVPAIPEPGTWALMGLGLLGVAAATRRQRHTVTASRG